MNTEQRSSKMTKFKTGKAEEKKWLVTNIETGRSVEVDAINANQAVNIAHRSLKDHRSENEYTWKQLSNSTNNSK